MSFSPEAVREFEHAGWQLAAPDYDDTFARASAPFAEALLDAAAIAAGTRVLDLCCGTGVVSAAAARRGATITGLDFSPAMLARARAACPSPAFPSITFDQGDAESLPYADGAFAAAVANFGLHHVPDPARAAAEIYRVLRPGGRVALTSWAEPDRNLAWGLLFKAIRHCGDPDASDTPPSGGGLSSAEAVSRLLAGGGFEAVETSMIERVWPLPDGAALVAALRRGTVRTAALISAQAEAAMPAIVAEVQRLAEPYRGADGLRIPIVAILGSGVKRG